MKIHIADKCRLNNALTQRNNKEPCTNLHVVMAFTMQLRATSI